MDAALSKHGCLCGVMALPIACLLPGVQIAVCDLQCVLEEGIVEAERGTLLKLICSVQKLLSSCR